MMLLGTGVRLRQRVWLVVEHMGPNFLLHRLSMLVDVLCLMVFVVNVVFMVLATSLPLGPSATISTPPSTTLPLWKVGLMMW